MAFRRDHKVISIPPTEEGEYVVSPLHARTSTEMYAHALTNITSPTASSSPSTSKISPVPSSTLAKQDSSSTGVVCCCSVCQDVIGNYTNETACDTAARWLRMMNRSFIGEAIKFITTVALALDIMH